MPSFSLSFLFLSFLLLDSIRLVISSYLTDREKQKTKKKDRKKKYFQSKRSRSNSSSINRESPLFIYLIILARGSLFSPLLPLPTFFQQTILPVSVFLSFLPPSSLFFLFFSRSLDQAGGCEGDFFSVKKLERKKCREGEGSREKKTNYQNLSAIRTRPQ